jgi:hypothetical protein
MTVQTRSARWPATTQTALRWSRPLRPEEHRAALLEIGDLIESLDGGYAAGPDIGTGPYDMLTIAKRTRHVVCRPGAFGGSGDSSVAAPNTHRRPGKADPAIRRVYLRGPDDGQAELAATREARSGQPSRGHWVRGHWKRQWHPSIEEHRQRWIEGYPRGDFGQGGAPGTKVLIARRGPNEEIPLETGLMAVEVGNVVRVLDAHDLVIAGAVIVRHSVAGRSITPDLVWAAVALPTSNDC